MDNRKIVRFERKWSDMTRATKLRDMAMLIIINYSVSIATLLGYRQYQSVNKYLESLCICIYQY